MSTNASLNQGKFSNDGNCSQKIDPSPYPIFCNCTGAHLNEVSLIKKEIEEMFYHPIDT